MDFHEFCVDCHDLCVFVSSACAAKFLLEMFRIAKENITRLTRMSNVFDQWRKGKSLAQADCTVQGGDLLIKLLRIQRAKRVQLRTATATQENRLSL